MATILSIHKGMLYLERQMWAMQLLPTLPVHSAEHYLCTTREPLQLR